MKQQNHPQTQTASSQIGFDPENEIHEYTQLLQDAQWQEITERVCLRGKRLVWAGRLNFLKELLDALTTQGIVHPRVTLLYGEIFQTRGQLSEASHSFRQVCSSPHHDERTHIEGWLKYGQVCLRQGHLKEAETAFHTSYTKALQHHPKEEIQSLHALGELQMMAGQLQRAQEQYEQAFDRAQHVQEGEEIGYSYAFLGHIQAAKGNIQAALDLYRKGLELVNQNEHRYMASLLEFVGWALQKQGEMSEALTMYEQSLALRISHADLLGKALVLDKIGHLFYARHWKPLEDMAASSVYNPSLFAENMEETITSFPDTEAFQAAQEKHQQCLDLSRSIEYKHGMIKALNALGVLSLYLERTADAPPILTEALALCQESGDKIEEAVTLENLGFVFYYTGKWDQATTSYTKSLHIHQTFGNTRKIAKLHMQFGRIYLFQDDYVSVFTHFFTALALNKVGGFDEADIQRHILFQRNQLKPKQFLNIAHKAKKHLPEELKSVIDIEELMTPWEVQDLTVRHESPKVGRNDPCPCGSGKKYKKCCGR